MKHYFAFTLDNRKQKAFAGMVLVAQLLKSSLQRGR